MLFDLIDLDLDVPAFDELLDDPFDALAAAAAACNRPAGSFAPWGDE